MAMKGHFKGIIKEAKLIQQREPKFVAFGEKMEEFARDFQAQELIEFIQQYLDNNY